MLVLRNVSIDLNCCLTSTYRSYQQIRLSLYFVIDKYTKRAKQSLPNATG